MKNNKRSVTFCGSSVHFHMFSLKAKSDLIYCILHFLPERKYWVLSPCVWLLEDMSFILVRNVVIMFISSAVSLCLYLVTAELSLFSRRVARFVVVRWSHGRAEVSLAELVLSFLFSESSQKDTLTSGSMSLLFWSFLTYHMIFISK